jgi:hypothetical protein
MTLINSGTLIGVSELLRFHILLGFKGITTLEYLKNADKVSKNSKVNVKIKNVDQGPKKSVDVVQCGCFRMKQEPMDNVRIAPIAAPKIEGIELT